MATASWDLGRFRLPMRQRTLRSKGDTLTPRIALADLLASLPNIVTKESSTNTLSRDVDVYVGWRETDWVRHASRSSLLCRISADGILVHGLSDDEIQEITSQGWGRVCSDGVHVFPPCDEDDLQNCWRILQHAYNSVSASMKSAAAAPSLLPSFSPTRLQ